MLIAARQFFTGKRLPYDAEVVWIEATTNNSETVIDTGVEIPAGASEVYWEGYAMLDLDTSPNNRNFVASFSDQNTLNYCEFDKQGAFGAIGWNVRHFTPVTNAMRMVSMRLSSKRAEYTSEYGGNVQTVISTQAGIYLATGARFSLFRLATYCYGKGVRIGANRLRIDNELLLDFIPVRFTNELGQSEGAMYDKVSGELFRNQGTGSFTIGPDKN